VIIRGTQITPLAHVQEVSLSRHVTREQEIRSPPRSRSTSGVSPRNTIPPESYPWGPSRHSAHSGSISKRSHARADLYLARASITSGPPSPPRSRLPRSRVAKSASPEPVSGNEDKARPKANEGHPHSMRTPIPHSATTTTRQQSCPSQRHDYASATVRARRLCNTPVLLRVSQYPNL
jgi:hypothetical protein